MIRAHDPAYEQRSRERIREYANERENKFKPGQGVLHPFNCKCSLHQDDRGDWEYHRQRDEEAEGK